MHQLKEHLDDAREAAESIFHRTRRMDFAAMRLPPAEGYRKYDTTPWQGRNLYLELDHADALIAMGLPDDGSNRSESFLDARRGALEELDREVANTAFKADTRVRDEPDVVKSLAEKEASEVDGETVSQNTLVKAKLAIPCPI